VEQKNPDSPKKKLKTGAKLDSENWARNFLMRVFFNRASGSGLAKAEAGGVPEMPTWKQTNHGNRVSVRLQNRRPGFESRQGVRFLGISTL
jgi:hypothetical protein